MKLQMLVILPGGRLQPGGLLSCRGVGTGVSERAGSWHGNTALVGLQTEQNIVELCITEVRAAMGVAVEEEEGLKAVKDVQHAHITPGLPGYWSILRDEHYSEVVPPKTMTHCLLPSLAPLQSVSLQFLLQHIFICSVPLWLFN